MISPLLSENMYLLVEDGHCVLIDPDAFQQDQSAFEGLEPDFMLVTHEHYDHISGVNAYRERYGIKLYANETCNRNMGNTRKNFAKYEDAYIRFQRGEAQCEICVDPEYTCSADVLVKDGDVIFWHGHEIMMKMAPGHSEGSNLLIVDGQIIFSGDCLLPENIPATRFPGGKPVAFEEETLPYLRSLSGEMMVYPGHGDAFVLRSYFRLQEGSHE